MFIFDHSCGHDRVRKEGLNATNMNSGYGVSQLEMHPTNTNQNFVYLGLNEKIIEIGDYQNMVFQEGSN